MSLLLQYLYPSLNSSILVHHACILKSYNQQNSKIHYHRVRHLSDTVKLMSAVCSALADFKKTVKKWWSLGYYSMRQYLRWLYFDIACWFLGSSVSYSQLAAWKTLKHKWTHLLEKIQVFDSVIDITMIIHVTINWIGW